MSLSVTFIEGSALIDRDLQRAHVSTAVAVFIMANKFSAHADEEDAKTILQQLSIKRFCASSLMRTEKLYCMQLIRPENQRHLSSNQSETQDANVVVVCFNEIKMGVLAKAIMFPGTNTLIMNLISSFSEIEGDDDDDDERLEIERKRNMDINVSRRGSAYGLSNDYDLFGDDVPPVSGSNDANLPDRMGVGTQAPQSLFEKVGTSTRNLLNTSSLSTMGPGQKKKKEDWLSEYQAGCDWEIYSTPLCPVFNGVRFVDLAYVIFQRLGVVVFGLQIKDVKCNLTKVFLNPAKFVIPENTDFIVSAFVLAKNKAESELLNMDTDDIRFFGNALRKSKTTTAAAAPDNNNQQDETTP